MIRKLLIFCLLSFSLAASDSDAVKIERILNATVDNLDRIYLEGKIKFSHPWQHHIFHENLFFLCHKILRESPELKEDLLCTLDAIDNSPVEIAGQLASFRLNLQNEILLLKGELPHPWVVVDELVPSCGDQFEEDWEESMQILDECFNIGPWPLFFDFEVDKDEEGPMEGIRMLVARDLNLGGKVVGFAWVSLPVCDLRLADGSELEGAQVWCLELGGRRAHYPHAKIGRKFREYLIVEKARFVTLWAEADNEMACDVYRHYGMVEAQRSEGMVEFRFDWENRKSRELPFEFMGEPPTPQFLPVKGED